jgi:membrane protease subunit (stomatin/prohibitin family)
MALMDFIKKQFIDILQWTEEGDGTLAWRFPMQEMEIQNGASLTVRDSQMAMFVNEGTVADVFSPGMYKLTTQTLPVLTYLKNWDKLFESPFKSDVYFFSTRTQLDQKWGTPNPITIRDKDFGIVRMRAFGIYSYHLTDPKTSTRRFPAPATPIPAMNSKASCATDGRRHDRPVRRFRRGLHRHGRQPGRVRQGDDVQDGSRCSPNTA